MSEAAASVRVVVQVDEDGAGPDIELDTDRWRHLAERSLVTEGVAAGELGLTFTNMTTMTELNVEHMGGDGPTDVLAFPIDGESVLHAGQSGDGDMPLLLGDVVICPAVAARNARSHGRTVDDELALLVVHGILHVLGHDHAEPGETAAMQARERALLAAHHR